MRPTNFRVPVRTWASLLLAISLLALPSIACLGSAALSDSSQSSTQIASQSQQVSDLKGASENPDENGLPIVTASPIAESTPTNNRAIPAENETTPTGESTPTAPPVPTPPPSVAGLASPSPGAPFTESTSIIRVAQLVRPAVVNITTQQIAYDWYLRPIPEESGAGSGVIFDHSGLILTNNHVVEGAQGITVALPDGRTFEGQVVGTDSTSDLAVVRINGQDLPAAQLGDSDALQIGEQVVAIGNALALPGGPTVTSGIVGALGRSIREPNGAVLYDLIQTDAAINPGNSGGPLVNLRGQVVGINTAIADAPGGGIGFAIAINAAKPIAEQLVSQGHVTRAWIGATFQNVTPGLAARYNLGVKKGVLVWSVVRNTPAAKAGLRRGDIIVQFGNSQIDDDVAMLKSLAASKVGDRVPIVIVREGKKLQIDIVLEEMPTS